VENGTDVLVRWDGKLNEINGWGTWIRTKINGVRVRCSTVELSPTKPLMSNSFLVVYKSRPKSFANRLDRGSYIGPSGLPRLLSVTSLRGASGRAANDARSIRKPQLVAIRQDSGFRVVGGS
jgi:hypothetical protein